MERDRWFTDTHKDVLFVVLIFFALIALLAVIGIASDYINAVAGCK